MDANKKINLYLAGLTMMTFAAFVATTAGSLAWYAYSTRARLSYRGVSVSKTFQLQIGIVDDDNYIDDDEMSQYKLSRENRDSHSIVWATAGSGFTSGAINSYLEDTNYATNLVSPITSRSMESDGDLSLYRAPAFGVPSTSDLAVLDHYVLIPFVFRVVDSSNQFVKNQDLWVTDAFAHTSGEMNVDKAVRVYFEGETNSFLLNPSSDETSSDARETVMGGLLDLNGDGYYDYNPSTMEEIIYGEYEGELTYSEPITADSAFENVNGVDHSQYIHTSSSGVELATTFFAKHKAGVKKANYQNLTYKVGKYETLSTVRPDVDASQYFSNGKPVGKTSNDTNALVYLNVTIFVEGWDHVVIDQSAGHRFTLGITYEINRV